MIEDLHLRDLGVIAEAELQLGPGLNVLTGETGAGKTMVLSGLALLLGGRADSGLVRRPAPRAQVDGVVLLPVGDGAAAEVRRRVQARVEDAGGAVEDGRLVLSRSVEAEGRSKAVVGGRSTPAAVLADLAGDLVAVHGQSDQVRLLQPARQRALLDRFAGPELDGVAQQHAEAFDRWRSLHQQLTDEQDTAYQRAVELAWLRRRLEEVEALDPQPGEDVSLAEEETRLAHLDQLRSAAAEGYQSLAGAGEGVEVDVQGLLGAARVSVERAVSLDPGLAPVAERLHELEILAGDLAGELLGYAADLEARPDRLATVSARRHDLTDLLRRHAADLSPQHDASGADSIDELLAWSALAARRLSELEDAGSDAEGLAAKVDAAAAAMADSAGVLSRARCAAAETLAAAVTAELNGLAMPEAGVEVQVSRLERVHRHGIDDVALLLRSGPGQEARPLGRGASGGELSRIMLALEVVLAAEDPVPTLVFDEVDAGVGGRTAVEVARRLARLARHHQVVVVTHLAQVAAFADVHLVVEKDSSGEVTTTGVRRVDESERHTELARMMAGMDGSGVARTHAEELLALAQAHRSG